MNPIEQQNENSCSAEEDTHSIKNTIIAYDNLFTEIMQEFTKVALCNKEIKGTDLYKMVEKAEEKMNELRIKHLYIRKGWNTVNNGGKNE